MTSVADTQDLRTFFRPWPNLRQPRYEPTGKPYAGILGRAVQTWAAGDLDGAARWLTMLFAEHGLQPHACLLQLSLERRLGNRARLREGMEEIVQLWPNWYHGLVNYGLFLQEQGEYEAAIRQYRRVLDREPDMVDAIMAMGMAYLGLGDLDTARRWLARSLEYAPPTAKEMFRLRFALAYLGRADLFYVNEELRWEAEDNYSYDQGATPGVVQHGTLWVDQPLAGKTLLVLDEQGVGDIVQFARWLPSLVEEAATVWVRLKNPNLRPLLAMIAPGVQFVSHLEPPPLCDFYVGIMSLFHRRSIVQRRTPAFPQTYIPGRSPTPDPQRWGICWAGATTHPRDSLRSASWEAVLPLIEAFPDIAWLDLTVGRERPEHPRVTQLTPRDYADTVAQLAGLGRVITVDTSVAHVAGAMGIPVHLLLATAPDVRWLAEGDTTPWYESATLVRQQRPNDWTHVIEQLIPMLQEASCR